MIKFIKKLFGCKNNLIKEQTEFVSENDSELTFGDRGDDGFADIIVDGKKTGKKMFVFTEEQIEKIEKIKKEIDSKEKKAKTC